jgi:hypothetical protein
LAVVVLVLGGVEIDGVEDNASNGGSGAEEEIAGAADDVLAGPALADDEDDGVGVAGEDDAVGDGDDGGESMTM